MQPSPYALRGVVYARQSLTRDGSESLPSQVAACREAAHRFGIEVVAELVEPPSTSGFKRRGLARPRFGEMLTMIEDGRANCVVVYKSDRLSRGGGPGWAPFLEACERRGLDPDRLVWTPSGSMSEFECGIRGTMDREESKKTSERVTMATRIRALAGKPHSGGCRPFGRLEDGVTPHPTEAPVVRQMAQATLARRPAYAIAQDLNNAGVRTAQGNLWDLNKIRQVLTSPRMAALRKVGDQLIPGDYEPIISPLEWEAICAVYAERSRGRIAKRYYLAGLLECALCGATLKGSPSVRKRNSYLYRCPPKAFGGCGRLSISAHLVEGELRNYIFGAIHLGATSLRDIDLDDAATPSGQEIVILQGKLERLKDLYVDGDLDQITYRQRAKEIRDHIAAVRSEMLRPPMPFMDLPADGEDYERWWGEMPVEAQNHLARTLIERVIVKPSPSRGRVWHPERLHVVPAGGTGA